MNINEIGGEFELIKRNTISKPIDSNVIKGIGDDCAVLKYKDGLYQLVTTDMMVENDHFNTKWHTPAQIGKKLMESNVSDIVCKGGKPVYAFLSMSLRKEITVEFMDDFYKGLYESAARHGVYLVGGDTTHGTEIVFNLTLLGEIKPELLRLRSMARPGDLIAVTGTLGGSTAGLKLLLKGVDGYLDDHLEPLSRTQAEGGAIALFANAAIDVSDGLGSEVRHICNESQAGACINWDAIPLSQTTRQSAIRLNDDPYDWALYGGEDFEIVFTIPAENVDRLRKQFEDFTIVGKILDKSEGLYILKEGVNHPVKKGYDHFA